MSTIHGLACNGCGATIMFTRERGGGHPTKATIEQVARDTGWNAPDKAGRHWCPQCRRPDGRRKDT